MVIINTHSTNTHRRSEVVANLVGQRQLRDLGRHPAIVVDERDDARVQRPLRALVQSPHRLRVRLVLFTNATGRTRGRRDPGQAECAAGKVAVREHIGQTKVLVVSERVNVEEVGHVNVLHAKRIRLARVRLAARRVIVDLDALHLQRTKVFRFCMEIGI